MKSFLFLIKCEITSYALEFIKGKTVSGKENSLKGPYAKYNVNIRNLTIENISNSKYRISTRFVTKRSERNFLRKMTNHSFLIVKLETSIT